MSTQNFFRRLHALAVVSRFEMDEQMVELYDRHLAPLGYDRLCVAIEEIFVNRSARDPFPSIKEIKDVVERTIPERAEADAICARILQCFNRQGYTFPWINGWDDRKFSTFNEALISEVGSVGANVIKQMGGYSVAYNEWRNTMNLQSFRAQLRDLVASTLTRRERGALPELEHSEQTSEGVRALMSDLLPQMPLK